MRSNIWNLLDYYPFFMMMDGIGAETPAGFKVGCLCSTGNGSGVLPSNHFCIISLAKTICSTCSCVASKAILVSVRDF